MNLLRLFLFPFAALYGIITGLRNKFFDWGLLPSQTFQHPLIGIGNLSTGGTGKTPHVEYLVQLLKPSYQLATLSRGYKRKTRGYQQATTKSTVDEIGDEPLQLFHRHPEVVVSVCEKRVIGVKSILEAHPRNQVILLDDVFQHRYIKPGLNILLTDYHNLFTRNYLLPTGNLRECRSGVKRADALIVTKTPAVFSPLDKRLILEELKKYAIKHLYFSYIKYGDWVPLTPCATSLSLKKAKTIFLLTGIANPVPLGEHLKRNCCDLRSFSFADHYQFKPEDIQHVLQQYQSTYSCNKVIITTEKDAMRLRTPELAALLKEFPVYYIPIEIDFHDDGKARFDKMILDYVRATAPVPMVSKQKRPSSIPRVKA